MISESEWKQYDISADLKKAAILSEYLITHSINNIKNELYIKWSELTCFK